MDKHRVTCGPLGKGTPSSRLKAAWKNSDMKNKSLRQFVLVLVDAVSDARQEDAIAWLESK